MRAAVREGSFRPAGTDVFGAGLWSDSVWWLRLSVANRSALAKQWVLVLDNHFVDEVGLYVVAADGNEQHSKAGDRYPFATRPLPSRAFAFPVVSLPGRTEIYLRLQTRGAKEFPLRVFSKASFQQHQRAELMLNGTFLGALMILFLYNLFLFLAVRDLGYLYVALIVLVNGVFCLWAFGFGFQFLWPNLPVLNDRMAVAVPLSYMSFVPYFRRILETRLRTPALDRCLVVFFQLALVFVCLYPAMPYSVFLRVGLAVVLPASLLFLIVVFLIGIVSLGTTYLAGRYYLAGAALLALFLGLLALILQRTVSDSLLAEAAARGAFVALSTLLSMSVLFKVRILRDNLQRLNAQRAGTVLSHMGPLNEHGMALKSTGANASETLSAETGTWSITPAMERKLLLALAYLRENYRDEISREGLAADLGVNPDNLGRLFKMYTGERLGDYVNRLRVRAAAWRLRDPQRRIGDIAVEVGFENASTFNRVFKNIMNTTPSRFRERATGGSTTISDRIRF